MGASVSPDMVPDTDSEDMEDMDSVSPDMVPDMVLVSPDMVPDTESEDMEDMASVSPDMVPDMDMVLGVSKFPFLSQDNCIEVCIVNVSQNFYLFELSKFDMTENKAIFF